jgi:nicotinate phosphoribosyltransferase
MKAQDTTDIYFVKSREAAVAMGHNPTVLWQVFQRNLATLAGVKPMLNQLDDLIDDWDDIEIWSLEDGALIQPGETVMLVKAPFQKFVEFESIYLGTLAEATKVATNVRAAVDAARGKPVLFFPARFTPSTSQYLHGYAAGVGGAAGCATQEQADGWSDYTVRPAIPIGTMPHALIAAFGGDTIAAAHAFAQGRRNEDIWALVDFANDCARTAVGVYRSLNARGLKLAGVRLDTSQGLVDEGLRVDLLKDGQFTDTNITENSGWRGVNTDLVRHVRTALNSVGARDVKIAVSGGFTPEKIAQFEANGAPADVYAVGEGFLRGSNPFTSDVVMRFEGTKMIPCAKVGREYKPNDRLKPLMGVVDTVGAV